MHRSFLPPTRLVCLLFVTQLLLRLQVKLASAKRATRLLLLSARPRNRNLASTHFDLASVLLRWTNWLCSSTDLARPIPRKTNIRIQQQTHWVLFRTSCPTNLRSSAGKSSKHSLVFNRSFGVGFLQMGEPPFVSSVAKIARQTWTEANAGRDRERFGQVGARQSSSSSACPSQTHSNRGDAASC